MIQHVATCLSRLTGSEFQGQKVEQWNIQK